VLNKYEAMFLLDHNAAADWAVGEAEVRRLLDRATAKVLGLKRWDERKLAYEIKRRKRGVYALVYFEAPADKIGDLERDAQISEIILRLLVLRNDDITPELVEKAMNAAPPPRTPERTSVLWSPRGPGRDRGDRFDRGDRGPRRDREYGDGGGEGRGEPAAVEPADASAGPAGPGGEEAEAPR
jgi:small subunit ribosomal protein S6